MMELVWTGPFRVKDILTNCLEEDQPWPPNANAVYLVSKDEWRETPAGSCRPLYIGGNTGRSPRFCTRIGDLVADMYGLWHTTGHHSGGQELYRWCKERNMRPGNLWLGWATSVDPDQWCGRCAEIQTIASVVSDWERRHRVGLLNRNRSPRCRAHDEWIP